MLEPEEIGFLLDCPSILYHLFIQSRNSTIDHGRTSFEPHVMNLKGQLDLFWVIHVAVGSGSQIKSRASPSSVMPLQPRDASRIKQQSCTTALAPTRPAMPPISNETSKYSFGIAGLQNWTGLNWTTDEKVGVRHIRECIQSARVHFTGHWPIICSSECPSRKLHRQKSSRQIHIEITERLFEPYSILSPRDSRWDLGIAIEQRKC
jgi:hypothetical protein